MSKVELLLGNESVARAAFEAGVTVATAYPGTPSTEITENIAKYNEIYCEWAPNEKVALEVAIGAAIAGARAICAMKHVGLNVAADPLFTASYTGINGGLVIMVADDPGMHSSQNEQDTRYYGLSAKVPVLEPSDSQECLDFVKKAFDISEEFDVPVIVRLTTRVAHSRSLVTISDRLDVPLKEYVKNPAKYVMMPAMARARHTAVEKRMRLLEQFAETTDLNRVYYDGELNVICRSSQREAGANGEAGATGDGATGDGVNGEAGATGDGANGETGEAGLNGEAGVNGDGATRKSKVGIITSGISYEYAMEADIKALILKLGMVHPLPTELIREFASRVDEVYIVEELSPFIEDFVKKSGVTVIGKDIFPATGELTTDLVKSKIGATQAPAPDASLDVAQAPAPDASLDVAQAQAPAAGASSTSELSPLPADLPIRPPVFCPGCPHRGIFYVLKKLKLIVTGDIGCYTLGAMTPLESIDTCVCMGASVSMAHGIDKARGKEFAKRTVAVVGDSTFLHSGITALIDIVYNKGMSTILILDNEITGMTGHQQNPATGYTIRNEITVRTDLKKLCEAIGVPSVRVADPFDVEGLEAILREELEKECPSVVIAERPCALLKSFKPGVEVWIDQKKCKRCKQCMKISCAAIADKEGGLVINKALCVRCGLCATICKFGAIVEL